MSIRRAAAGVESAAASRKVVSTGDAAAGATRVAAGAGVVTAPEATPEELAAILAAYEALWPHQDGATAPTPSPAWRWAGRSWRRRRAWSGWC